MRFGCAREATGVGRNEKASLKTRDETTVTRVRVTGSKQSVVNRTDKCHATRNARRVYVNYSGEHISVKSLQV